MTFDLTPVLGAVITLVITIMTAIVIPYIKKKIGDEKYAEIERWVGVAVQAAEQLFAGSGRGAEKLAFVEEFLASKGFKIDAMSLRNLIEAAVYNLTNLEVSLEDEEIKDEEA